MIIYKGRNYVIKNGPEDNGSYTYFYHTDTITQSYSINYNGYKGTFTITQVVYRDDSTNEIIAQDYYTWVLKYGATTKQGTALTWEEIQTILDAYNGEKIDTSLDDYDANDYDDDNDDLNNSYNKGEGEDSDKGKGLFDNTMGDSNKLSREDLPIGSDIYNPNITAKDMTIPEKPIPNQDTNLANKGTLYPIIRINDHYFTEEEIQFFSCETGYYKNYYDYSMYKMPVSGFIPTMKLIVTTHNASLLKKNFVKQGDRCAVFFTSMHPIVKSIRCDFRITNVVSSNMNQNVNLKYVRLIITGELYVPDLRNEEIRYNFNGSSRDAMMDLARRLRLSFFFCDPEDTDDVMVWCNCKTPEMFAKDLTTHAWKNPNSFFESFIDPRYGLSFLNINKLLLEDGFDEPIDVTFWINTFINSRSVDGNKINSVDENEKDETKIPPQAKLFTNIPQDDESATVYHVNKWRLINNAQEIQDFMGLNCKQQYEAVNPGLKDNPKYSVEFSLCLNRTKFDPTKDPKNVKEKNPNKFYVLLGPARNMTYADADDAMKTSETESSNKNEPEKVTNPQSDGDADAILATDGNMQSSGNTHKFYEVAYEHNMRNLLQLQKQDSRGIHLHKNLYH